MVSYLAVHLGAIKTIHAWRAARKSVHEHRDEEADFGGEHGWLGFLCPGMMQTSGVRGLKASPLLEFVSR
jgi:hypothetical protein